MLYICTVVQFLNMEGGGRKRLKRQKRRKRELKTKETKEKTGITIVRSILIVRSIPFSVALHHSYCP